MTTINDIQRLVAISNKPLNITWLDKLYDEYKNYVKDRITYYRFLYHLMLLCKPKVAVEIGVEYGVGSAHMVAAAETYGGHVIGIDINVPGAISTLIKHRNYNFVCGNSVSVDVINEVMQLTNKFGRIDLVFQDSSHHYFESEKEYSMYTCMANLSEFVWVCDDIHKSFKTSEDPLSMLEYFQQLPGDKMIFPELYPCGGNNVGVSLWKLAN